MSAVDFHQHLWPEVFIAALARRSEPPFVHGEELVTPEGAFAFDRAAHDPEARIAGLDRDGIDVAVLSLQSSLGIEALDTSERNELELAWAEGARALVAGSGGRFRALAPWRILPGFAGTSVGTSALLQGRLGDGVLAAADAVGGLVFVHPEAAGPLPPGRPAWWGWLADYPTQLQHAYLAWVAGGRETLPSVRLVFAMLAGGAPILHERLAHRGVEVRGSLDTNTLFDVSTHGRRAIELVIETFGVERLVYGSDVPVVDPQPTLRAVRGFGESIARYLCSTNPQRILA